MCSSPPPAWLPEMLSVFPWTDKTLDMLYDYFCVHIRNGRLYYNSHKIIILRDMDNGKEKIFWHLTSRDQTIWDKKQKIEVKERLPDPRRSERLSWIKPIILNHALQEILCWDYLEGDGRIKTYMWLKDHDFVVVLKRFPDGNRLLITSFYVDKKHTKAEFERKYAERMA